MQLLSTSVQVNGVNDEKTTFTREQVGRHLRSARAASGKSLEEIAICGQLKVPPLLHLERGTCRSKIAAQQYINGLRGSQITDELRGRLNRMIEQTDW